MGIFKKLFRKEKVILSKMLIEWIRSVDDDLVIDFKIMVEHLLEDGDLSTSLLIPDDMNEKLLRLVDSGHVIIHRSEYPYSTITCLTPAFVEFSNKYNLDLMKKRTIKMTTVIDRARLKGVEFVDDYMQDELLITGVGEEKEASVSDMINPTGVFLNLVIARKTAMVKTFIETDLTNREIKERYGCTLFDMRVERIKN